jgi:hypothetical protein
VHQGLTSDPGTGAVSPDDLGVECDLARMAGNGDVDDVLEEVVRRIVLEAGAISLPTLCNGLWLGWGGDGYDGPVTTPLIDEIPVVVHGYPVGHPRRVEQPAIPLGAIVQLELGSDYRYAEVVYKEGAHPALGDGWAPRWLAGAPSLPQSGGPPPADYEPVGTLPQRERLVLDFACFGQVLVPEPAKMTRLREKGYRLDKWGHLVVDALYPDEEAEEDDVSFWANWVVGHYPSALAAAGLPSDPGYLLKAASRLADTLEEDERIRSFGPYYLAADTYTGIVAEEDQELGVLPRVARSLARSPRGAQTSWASMSELLSYAAREAMSGTAWATYVVAATLYVLDVLAEEAPTGDWNGVHLRLDDPWQGGGLWRAEQLGLVGPVAADPAVALGLGWVEHTGGSIERIEGPSPEDAVPAPEWFGEDGDEWEVSGSEATWMLHVTGPDIDTDRLRIPAKFSPYLAATLEQSGQDRLAVRLSHDGGEETTTWAPIGVDGHLEYPWPTWFLAGTTVWAQWSIGGRVVRLSTRLLAESETVAGVEFTHEFNVAVALAALGKGPVAVRALTLRQLIRAAVRRRGDVTEDGRRCLDLASLVRLCFGPDGQVAPGFHDAVLRQAVIRAARHMARSGDVEFDGDLVLVSEPVTRAGRDVDRELLNRYLNSVTQRVRRQVARCWVPPSVVNLPDGWTPSKEKRETWGDVAGTDGLPEVDLEPRQTWRKGYIRDGVLAPQVEDELVRAKRALVKVTGSAAAVTFVDDIARDPFAEDNASDGSNVLGMDNRSERSRDGGSDD